MFAARLTYRMDQPPSLAATIKFSAYGGFPIKIRPNNASEGPYKPSDSLGTTSDTLGTKPDGHVKPSDRLVMPSGGRYMPSDASVKLSDGLVMSSDGTYMP